MDAPPIQYAKTTDGVSIAFWTVGEGPPLVILPSLVSSHVRLEWDVDVRRMAYERLAERANVIHYDPRGMGLSAREYVDFSPEAQALDLEAVVGRLELDRFALYGSTASGDVVLVYPANHPERVSHLVVYVAPVPRGFLRRLNAIRPVAERDWELYADIYARFITGWDSPQAPQTAAMVRESHTHDSLQLAFDALGQQPPEDALAAIQTPTLILHSVAGDQLTQVEVARKLAGAIQGAHMLGIPAMPVGSLISETIVNAILNFINTAPSAPGAPIAAPQVDLSAVRTIVFTDVEGSTALNERLGDEGARKVLREHERLTREALGAHGGSEVKAMGDGFMVWFPSATRAVECAIALQKAFAARNETGEMGNGEEVVRVRIGINAGEPIAEGDDLFGASVIATARIAATAQGGQILASDVVRQLLAGKGFTFEERGEHALKGFDEPARLYEVRWEESA